MKHRIYVVGMGPGQENMMTQEAGIMNAPTEVL